MYVYRFSYILNIFNNYNLILNLAFISCRHDLCVCECIINNITVNHAILPCMTSNTCYAYLDHFHPVRIIVTLILQLLHNH